MTKKPRAAIFKNHGFGWASHGARAVCPRSGDLLIKLGIRSPKAAAAWIDSVEAESEKAGRNA